MDLNDLKLFLEKFQIEEDKIDLFLENKKIMEIENFIYLIDSNFRVVKEELPPSQNLVYIKLRGRELPSKYFLNEIKKMVNSNLIGQISSSKQANNFVFSKNFSFDSIGNVRMQQQKYYLVEFEGEILGYVTLDKKDKKTPIQNLFNIGEYLLE